MTASKSTAIGIQSDIQETKPESRSLAQMLRHMRDVDDGVVEHSYDELVILGDHFRQKIDDYKKWEDTQRLRAQYFQDLAAEYTAAANTILNDNDKLKQYMLKQMEIDGRDLFVGDLFKVKKVTRTGVSVDFAENSPKASAETFENETLRPFIRKKESYEWGKIALKADIKAKGVLSVAHDFVLFRESKSEDLRWSPVTKPAKERK